MQVNTSTIAAMLFTPWLLNRFDQLFAGQSKPLAVTWFLINEKILFFFFQKQLRTFWRLWAKKTALAYSWPILIQGTFYKELMTKIQTQIQIQMQTRYEVWEGENLSELSSSPKWWGYFLCGVRGVQEEVIMNMMMITMMIIMIMMIMLIMMIMMEGWYTFFLISGGSKDSRCELPG